MSKDKYKNNKKKADQLGMPLGTASGKLKKIILFSLLKELNKDYCFQCGLKIESEKELSIEHKIPYLDSENPLELFFDINNIAFSHLSCNSGAARKTIEIKHPSQNSYKQGCRCEECKQIQKNRMRVYRKKVLESN